MRKALLVAVLIALTGCGLTPKGDSLRDTAKAIAIKIADEHLKRHEWGLCVGSTIGALKRRYGSEGEKIAAYANYCDQASRAAGVSQ